MLRESEFDMMRDQPIHIACLKASAGMDTESGSEWMFRIHCEKKRPLCAPRKSHDLLALSWLLISCGLSILGLVALSNL